MNTDKTIFPAIEIIDFWRVNYDHTNQRRFKAYFRVEGHEETFEALLVLYTAKISQID